MMESSRHMVYLVGGQALYNLGRADMKVIIVRRNTSLAKVVESPGPDSPLRVECKAVVEANKDLRDGFSRQVDSSRHQGLRLVTANQSAAELALVTGAPGVNDAVVGQGEDVVDAGGQLLDVFEAGDLDGLGLEAIFRCRPFASFDFLLQEAKGPIISLVYSAFQLFML